MYKQLKQKNILKSCLLIVVLLFMLCLFSGCANVTYYIVPGSDCYTEGVQINLTSEDAEKYGYNLNTLAEQVQDVLQNEAIVRLQKNNERLLKKQLDENHLKNQKAIFLCGENYYKYLLDYFEEYELPLKGLPGMGYQIQYMKSKMKRRLF